MRLSDVNKGSFIFIDTLPPGEIRRQGIRLGLLPGAKALCLSVLPGGPVVLLLGTQEIAVGRRLARQIIVNRWNRPHNSQEQKTQKRRTQERKGAAYET